MENKTLTILPEDLEVAIERKESGEVCTVCCVVSTAAQRQFESPELHSAGGLIYGTPMEDNTWYENKDLEEVMNLFDKGRYEEIELPATFDLKFIRSEDINDFDF